MVRNLQAPRWAQAAVIGTFAVAMAILVTGLSASASPGSSTPPQQMATSADWGQNGDNHDGDNHDGKKCDDNNNDDMQTDGQETDGQDGDNHDGDKNKCPTKTVTETTTATETATETVTETSKAPTTTMTKLPVTGSSSRSPLILVGSTLLLAGFGGMLGLRRWRRVADRRG